MMADDENLQRQPARKSRFPERIRSLFRNIPDSVSSRSITALWMLGAFLAIWSSGYAIVAGSDLFWHLAAGRWIVEHRGIPVTDPWSFTGEGHSWKHTSWLSDVILALWTDTSGITTLVWWKWLIISVTYLALLLLLYRLAGDWLTGYACVLTAIALASPFLDIRPNLFSFLGFVVLLFLALRPQRVSPWLPLLFLLWGNLHGSYIMGIVSLLIISAGSILHGAPQERKRVLIIAAACVAASLMNPAGLSIFSQLFKYSAASKSSFRLIAEWQSPLVPGGIQTSLLLSAVLIYLVALTLWKNIPSLRPPPRIAFSVLALSGFTLIAALHSRRLIPFFGIAETLVIAPVMAHFVQKIERRIPSAVLALSSVVFGLFLIAPCPKSSSAFHYMTAGDSFPIDTCDFIEANHLSGRMFSYYNWGGYLHYRFRGRIKVFIDGRAHLAYDDDTISRYREVQKASSGAPWIEIIESSGAEYFLWPKNKKLQILSLLGTYRWSILYGDSVSVLLVRKEKVPLSLVSQGDSPYYQTTLGVSALERGASGEAERHFTGALQQMPFLCNAYLYLARAQSLQGRSEEARDTIRRFKKMYPYALQPDSVKEMVEVIEQGSCSFCTIPR